MSDVSYIISPQVKLELERIEHNRQQILLLLVPRERETEAHWQACIEKTNFAARLSDDAHKMKEAATIVNPFTPQANKIENDNFFQSYLWIDKKWFLNRRTVELADVKKVLSSSGFEGKYNAEKLIKASEFVQVAPEHPIVQAALLFCFLYAIVEPHDNIKTLSIVSNIFIYKGGYDFRGLLVMEEYFANDLAHLKKLLSDSFKNNNLSQVLEYYVQAVAIQSEKALNKLRSYQPADTSLFALTERQKEIMVLFDRPAAKITNRKVQKEFGISQITASRDLAKLNTLNLIFKNGRGRSIYYTKF